MASNLHPRIVEKIKENSINEIYNEFILKLLRQEFLHTDKASWPYKKYYQQRIIEYADKIDNRGEIDDN